MQGQPIHELNDGLTVYKDELSADSLAAKRVEVALVTFGGHVNVVSDFTAVDQFMPPSLVASGDTPMGSAINQGLDLLKTRKDAYRSNGISFYRPWVFLITDGGPTDEWKSAAVRVKEGEAQKAFAFFSVGVQGANMDVLSQISTREPLKLQGLKFRDLFQWLSNSQQSVSRSTPGDEVPLQNPAGPVVGPRFNSVWKYVYASAIGTSHATSGAPCQDACRVALIDSLGTSTLVLVCSDGAGSASLSEIGSNLACEEFVRGATEWLALGARPNALTHEIARDMCVQIRSALEARAAEFGVTSRELACTLVAAIVAEDSAAFLQVGDGGIVIREQAETLKTVFWPESGEYINTTFFLSDARVADRVQFGTP